MGSEGRSGLVQGMLSGLGEALSRAAEIRGGLAMLLSPALALQVPVRPSKLLLSAPSPVCPPLVYSTLPEPCPLPAPALSGLWP